MLTPLGNSFNCFTFPMPKNRVSKLVKIEALWNELPVENDFNGPDGYVLKEFMFNPSDYLRKHLLADKTFNEVMDEYVKDFHLNEDEAKSLMNEAREKTGKYTEIVPCKITPFLAPFLFSYFDDSDLKYAQFGFTILLQSRKQDLFRLKEFCLEEEIWTSEHFYKIKNMESITFDMRASRVKELKDECLFKVSYDVSDHSLNLCGFNGMHGLIKNHDSVYIKEAKYSLLDCSFYVKFYIHENASIVNVTGRHEIIIERIYPDLLNKDLYK